MSICITPDTASDDANVKSNVRSNVKENISAHFKHHSAEQIRRLDVMLYRLHLSPIEMLHVMWRYSKLNMVNSVVKASGKSAGDVAILIVVGWMCVLGVRLDAEEYRADTTRFRSAEVRIEASRPVVPSLMGRTRSAELNDSDIVRLQTRQSAELLRYMPGVFMRDYGGLAGIKTVSLRGAAAAQTAVYVDGIRMNGTQNGLFDFSTLNSSFLQSVIVTDAVDATLSGAHAIGGIVMMTTKSVIDSSFHGSIAADGGSWNERGLVAQASGALASTAFLSASVDIRSAQGDYPFAFSSFGTVSTYRRTNADYTSRNAMITLGTRDGSSTTTTRAMVRSSGRGAPDAVTQGNIGTSSARLDDEAAMVMHSGTAGLSGTTELRWQAFGSFQTQQFSDTSSSLLGIPFRNRFISRDGGAAVSVHHQTAMADEVAVRVDVNNSDLRGDLLRFGAGNSALRNSLGVGAGGQSRAIHADDNLSVFFLGGIRLDANSDASPYWTPRVSVLARHTSGVDISLHFARAFRLPSFNELYYQNYGSTSLRAELASVARLTMEYALPQSIMGESSWVSVTLFRRATTNQIVAVPRSPVTWSAMNVATVLAQGCEVGMVSRISSAVLLRGGITIQDVRDQTIGARSFGKLLPYTPTFLGYAHCHVSRGGFSFGTGLNWCGERFTQTDNAASSALAPYATVQLFGGYEWKSAYGMIWVRAECDNILDMSYVIVANFPMPGRAIRASAGLTW